MISIYKSLASCAACDVVVYRSIRAHAIACCRPVLHIKFTYVTTQRAHVRGADRDSARVCDLISKTIGSIVLNTGEVINASSPSRFHPVLNINARALINKRRQLLPAGICMSTARLIN
jgi:hypothetical protein